jgi:ribosomal-protein-alanine N-acetyltransferase
MEKLGIRTEGVAIRMLEINGVWEDHVRYAVTAEEWHERANEFRTRWLLSDPSVPR